MKNTKIQRIASKLKHKLIQNPMFSLIRKVTKSNKGQEEKLYAAAWANDIERAKKLIAGGIDVNVVDSVGETPLHGAAAWGNIEMVRFLLSKGASPNIKNQDGDTPLHCACSSGTREVVSALIAGGAKNIKNGRGQSLLELAKLHNREKTIIWLKQYLC